MPRSGPGDVARRPGRASPYSADVSSRPDHAHGRRQGGHAISVTGLVLAHPGAGNTWQAIVTVAGVGVALVLLAGVVGLARYRGIGSLMVPLAAVAVTSVAGVAAADTLSDWVGPATVGGSVALIALVVVASRGIDLSARLGPATAILAVGAIAAVLAGPPLNDVLHPEAIEKARLPDAGDAVLTLVSPQAGSEVPAGEVDFHFVVTGGTIGPRPSTSLIPEPDTPTELGHVRLFVDNLPVTNSTDSVCTVLEPCSEVFFRTTLAPGTHKVTAEFVAYDGAQFLPLIGLNTTITAR